MITTPLAPTLALLSRLPQPVEDGRAYVFSTLIEMVSGPDGWTLQPTELGREVLALMAELTDARTSLEALLTAHVPPQALASARDLRPDLFATVKGQIEALVRSVVAERDELRAAIHILDQAGAEAIEANARNIIAAKWNSTAEWQKRALEAEVELSRLRTAREET